MSFKRVHVIVLDSVGIGQAPDAKLFNDEGADTLGNIAKYTNLNIPNYTQFRKIRYWCYS